MTNTATIPATEVLYAPYNNIMSTANDALRNAFNCIVRKAMPFMDIEFCYPTDMLVDAESAAKMAEGDVMFIMVRDCGTNMFSPMNQDSKTIANKCREAVAHVDACSTRRAVLRVTRCKFDRFDVRVCYEKS